MALRNNDDFDRKITWQSFLENISNCEMSIRYHVALNDQCHTHTPLICGSNNQYRCSWHQIYISTTIGTLFGQLSIFHWFENIIPPNISRYAQMFINISLIFIPSVWPPHVFSNIIMISVEICSYVYGVMIINIRYTWHQNPSIWHWSCVRVAQAVCNNANSYQSLT